MKEVMYEAGLVGCGGAGFPTHVKYSGGKIDTVIINGAECEPLLQTDQYLMRHFAGRLVKTAEKLRIEAGAKQCIFALKKTYLAEKEALEEAVRESGGAVTLCLLDSFFPAGDEQTLVYEVTGRIVPPASIPLDVGCAVTNVATLLGIADAMQGNPFTDKYLTVTGAVKEPVVVRVPLGTPVSEVLKLAGGPLISDYILVNGGPMMGKVLEDENHAWVTKTMSGLLVLPADSAVARRARASVAHMMNLAKSACIQCRYCSDLCPRALLGHPLRPHQIMRKFSSGREIGDLLEDADIRNAALCCECGVCEVFACPMGLQPRRINGLIKKELSEAGIRWQGQKEGLLVQRERAGRKIPTGRAAARAGVGAYVKQKTDTYRELNDGEVTFVRLELRQGIGAPSIPVDGDGAWVKRGERIAECPEGKLGSNLHASISGVVSVRETYMEIRA